MGGAATRGQSSGGGVNAGLVCRRNLCYVRSLAEAWPVDVVQQPVARLPWGRVTVLHKLDGRPDRGW